MTTRFSRNPEIGAGALPFDSVGRDPPTAGAKLREQMRQLVAQGAVDLSLAVGAETAIQENARDPEFRAASSCAESFRPLDAHLRRERGRTLFEQ